MVLKIQETEARGHHHVLVAANQSHLSLSICWSDLGYFCCVFVFGAATNSEPPKRKNMLEPGYHSNKHMCESQKDATVISTNHPKSQVWLNKNPWKLETPAINVTEPYHHGCHRKTEGTTSRASFTIRLRCQNIRPHAAAESSAAEWAVDVPSSFRGETWYLKGFTLW